MDDRRTLIHEKYQGDEGAPGLSEDIARLAAGEPLSYIIGTQPFLGLSISLNSKPLIPRPETEWWTEQLINYINNTNSTIYSTVSTTLKVLDVCAGSGAIGLAVLKHCPNARVSFGELIPEHHSGILENVRMNNLDESRADIRTGDLFTPFVGERFDIIATNPPYIPKSRVLDAGVKDYEPPEALYAGVDGLEVIRRIYSDISHYVHPGSEVWLECDIAHIDTVAALALESGARRTNVRTDQYDRPRLVIGYY